MGLPKPLGPFAVAFSDFELRRRRSQAPLIEDEKAVPVPPMRVFYPTAQQPHWWKDVVDRRWVMGISYAYGYVQNFMLPSSLARRILLWILAGVIYILTWPGCALAASVSSPILSLSEDGDKRLPVVIFSHGMWSCRTTYSAICCDLASHGYIVVAPEHLDGSSNATCYHDENQKRKWVRHAFSDVLFDDVPMENRSKQLRQRIAEIQRVVDVLEDIDSGLLTQDENVIAGKLSLNVSSLKGRLNLSKLTLMGHSFGGATAVAVPGIDARFRCCIGLDVWWEPVEEVDRERVAGKVPVLLLNTESFEWKKLTEARNQFLSLRAAASTNEDPLVTEVATIKETRHQDQSDIPLLFPSISKKIRLSGSLDSILAKHINNWLCLDFLERNLMQTRGSKLPALAREPAFAKEYLTYSK